ncbi:MAG TPA: DMT family transporter [Flavobacteriales bacterium]|nr:DMT family transporter [Flavobacteriales bacterium]
MPASRQVWAHLALFTVNFIYGVNYVVAKGLMPSVIGPSGFILLRVLGAGILFWSLRAMRPERVAPADLVRLLLCAITGVALNQLMFFHGLMRTTPLNASLIMVATPILVLVLAGVLLKERITWAKAVGVLLGAAGALVLVLVKPANTTAGPSKLGDLFILINATAYGLFLVLVKPLMRKYSAITIMAWSFLFGLLLVLPFGWQEFGAVQWQALSTAHVLALAFVVVMVTFVSYLMNTWAIGHVNPTVVGAYIYMQPVLAAVFTWLFVRIGPERLGIPGNYSTDVSPVQALCALCIFAGVYLVGRADR